MKFLFVLMAVLALILGGSQAARAAVRSERNPGAAALAPVAGYAGSRTLGCRGRSGPRRHRPAIIGFALVAETPGVSGGVPDSGREPRPWPEVLAMVASAGVPPDSHAVGRSCMIRLPARSPAPLERTCVLRI